MPWIAPSHQAPALSLKLWKPLWFSGLGLCIGSMAPDLEFILRLDDEWIVSHTLAAQVYFTAPLVLVLYALAVGLVLPWLLPLLPKGAPLYAEELAALRLPRSLREWVVVATSGSLGGLTHVLLDSVSHGNHSGWLVPFFPILRLLVPMPMGSVPLYDALHVTLTVVLGLLALGTWQRIARERLLWRWRGESPRAVAAAPVGERSRAIAWLTAWMAAGASTACAFRPVHGAGHALELGVYGALAFLAFGLVAGAIAGRIRFAARVRSQEGFQAEAAAGGSGTSPA